MRTMTHYKSSCPLYELTPTYDQGYAAVIHQNCGTCRSWLHEEERCQRAYTLLLLTDHILYPACPTCGWTYTEKFPIPLTARVLCVKCDKLFHPVKETITDDRKAMEKDVQ